VVLEDGSTKRIYVCSKCLKAGKVKKAVWFHIMGLGDFFTIKLLIPRLLLS
jgi:ribosomal protein L28